MLPGLRPAYCVAVPRGVRDMFLPLVSSKHDPSLQDKIVIPGACASQIMDRAVFTRLCSIRSGGEIRLDAVHGYCPYLPPLVEDLVDRTCRCA